MPGWPVLAVRGISDRQDLSQRVVVHKNDEIGGLLKAFNHLLGKMRDSIHQIGDHSHAVTVAAEDLSVASDQVKSGAHHASVSATEMAAAVEAGASAAAGAVSGAAVRRAAGDNNK